VTAAETLAEGEFNRFYVRALCRRQMSGDGQLVVHRAKQVQNPRPESEALIGTSPNAGKLLDDLRNNPGVEPALGVPKGPNSGCPYRSSRPSSLRTRARADSRHPPSIDIDRSQMPIVAWEIVLIDFL
jgi:hypothetical protein